MTRSQISHLFTILFTIVTLFISPYFSDQQVMAQNQCSIMIEHDPISGDDSEVYYRFTLPEFTKGQQFTVKTYTKQPKYLVNHYVRSPAHEPDQTGANPNEYYIDGYIRKSDGYSYPFTRSIYDEGNPELTGKLTIALYRMLDQKNPNSTAWDNLTEEYCEVDVGFVETRIPTVPDATSCALSLDDSTPNVNELNTLRATVFKLPDGVAGIYWAHGKFTIKDQDMGNEKNYTPPRLGHGGLAYEPPGSSVNAYLLKWENIAFSVPGVHYIDLEIFDDFYINRIGKCSLIATVSPPGQDGSVVIIQPTSTPIPVPTLSVQNCVQLCKTVQDCNINKNCLTCGVCTKRVYDIPDLAPLCEQVGAKHKSGEDPTACEKCIDPDVDSEYKGIWTAIGCVPTDMKTLLERYVFTYGISIAGGVAFLYFLYGCFLILTSTGNAERINQGKEIIISSLSGLLLIIFSVLILTIIGVDLLSIPGFSR